MKIIVDRRYIDIAKKQWCMKYEIIPSFCCEKIQLPVSAHPDMTLTRIEDIFVASPDSYEYYREILGKRVISGSTELSSHYPYDIAYNVLIYKNLAFGKVDYIDQVVKEELQKRKMKLINVNQGYAKCSTCVCSEGIITADDSIYKACCENSINALKIIPGFVELEGYDYGFIGGASGVIGSVLTFFGDIRKHPDYKKIEGFCDFDFIPDFPLTDIGTILCI